MDIFAPGTRIETTLPNNKYIEEGGTSISSALTAGVAGLIWSYYPNISASKMKEILMKSGNSYNIDISIENSEKTSRTLSFTELSKSGKVVNAYNALLLAEKVSKN